MVIVFAIGEIVWGISANGVLDKYNIRGSISLFMRYVNIIQKLLRCAARHCSRIANREHALYLRSDEAQERAMTERPPWKQFINILGKLFGYFTPALSHSEVTIFI